MRTALERFQAGLGHRNGWFFKAEAMEIVGLGVWIVEWLPEWDEHQSERDRSHTLRL